MNESRPPEFYNFGDYTAVPRRVAASLDRWLEDARKRVGRSDPEVYNVLLALRGNALAWRASVNGRTPRKEVEVEASSDMALTVTQVADLVGVVPRTIRLAISEKRLAATKVGSQWQITREAVEHYRAARTHR